MMNLIPTDIISLKCYDDLGGCSHTAIKGPNPTTQGENFSFQIDNVQLINIILTRLGIRWGGFQCYIFFRVKW